MGGLTTFLVKSDETDNRFLLLEARTVPGAEPPPHLHYDQDEVRSITAQLYKLFDASDITTRFTTRGNDHDTER